MEGARNPTEAARLQKEIEGYLTGKAEAFEMAYKQGKYQAAAFIKDQADAIYLFCRELNLLDEDGLRWYHGHDGMLPIFDPMKEANCRKKVDGELIQAEVENRFENLVNRMKHKLTVSLPTEPASAAKRILDDQLEEIKR